MTVARPHRPPTPMETAKQHVEQALGTKIAKRLDTYEDGTFFVSAGEWARLLAWFVDFLVYLFCAVGGFVALAVAKPDVSDGVAALAMLGLLVGVPVLYGLFYGNGRVLGALLTGTRLVRVRNGDRIGAWACWAMLVRTLLFPILLVALTTTGSVGVGSLRRISVDDAATRQLHVAGFLRLTTPGSVDQRR
ncbi:hypothetical protein [Actinophytocola glycyrrhizae]|uniref:RDD family protein n=1 Tax=Actinophytocola glycyrrhizae TaxID=2044873 RepID=A0ABV9RVI6_9PSEU